MKGLIDNYTIFDFLNDDIDETTPTITTTEKEDEGISKYEDFGAKIGGARKDMYSMTLADFVNLDTDKKIEYARKDFIWKKPNYQKLVDSGIPKSVVYYYKIVRDAFPAKLQTVLRGADLEDEAKKYFDIISTLRDDVMKCKTENDIINMNKWLAKHDLVDQYGFFTEKASVIMSKKSKLNSAINLPASYISRLYENMKKDEFLMSEDEKILNYTNAVFLDDFNVIQENHYGSNVQRIITSDNNLFYYYGDDTIRKGTYMLTKNMVALIVNGSSEEDVKNLYLVAKKLENTSKAKKNSEGISTVPAFLSKIERIGGPDYRNGKDATSKMFQDSFKFYGGEFGNWLNQNDRKTNMNFAYDALCDLATALGISFEDVSLSSKLSIGFGSRGRGGKSGAVAHYEPDFMAINLTKLYGAGSLGHEWIHAVDDIMGKVYSGQADFTSNEKRKKNTLTSFSNLLEGLKFKTIYGEEVVKDYEDYFNIMKKTFRKNLLSFFNVKPLLSDEENDRDYSQYKLLVDEVIKEFIQPDYHWVDFNDRGKVIYDAKPSDKYRKLMAFLSNRGTNIAGVNVKWANSQRQNLSYSYAHLQDIKNDVTKQVKKINTNYYNDACHFDKYRKTPYWSTDKELLARAGAIYIKDKLEKLGIKNDYLCGHAEGVNYEGHFTTPENEERKHINELFDAFFDELKQLGYFHSTDKKNDLSNNKNNEKKEGVSL